MGQPFISILIHNRDGRAALEGSLSSLANLDYRPERFEILLVDDGSTDDSVDFVRERFPAIRIASRRGNLGRIASINSALPQARGDYLAFLDPFIRVDPAWLRELVAVTEREKAAAVASRILDRDGRHIDDAGGIVSFIGHTWSSGRGVPVASYDPESLPRLFASGAAMLVNRQAYDAAGGFDRDYFTYGEDLDLGWRLSLLGHRVSLAPSALAYRDSEADPFAASATAPRLRLQERNALYTIYKCYGEELLSRVLPVAIALTLARALHYSSLPDVSLTDTPPKSTPVSRRTVATLLALEDFTRNLPSLRRKREAIQSRRRVSDEELLPRFVEPLKTHDLGPVYQRLAVDFFVTFGLGGGSEATHLPGRNEPLPSEETDSHPSVSIVIPTIRGAMHLPECLASLRGLDYSVDKIQVVVVDNGGNDDLAAIAREHYPQAEIVRLPENRGFTGGIAAGARRAKGDWLAFLNDDTRVDAGWMREMMATAERRGTPCVAARILNWTGDRIDYDGGGVSFEAKGFQLRHGSWRVHSGKERPVLFACGAAMLVRRDLFLATGGFDETMFAYYEDVAFGWELAIRGIDVWLNPRALVFHKHQGSAESWASPVRTRLYERNALRTVFTHLEPQSLERALPAALLLLNQRVLLTTDLFRRSSLLTLLHGGDRAAAYRMEAGLQGRTFDDEPEFLPAETAAGLLALHDWLTSLPEQRRRRGEIQQHRRRSDAEILTAFPAHWTHPARAEHRALYRRVHETVVKAFALEDMVSRQSI